MSSVRTPYCVLVDWLFHFVYLVGMTKQPDAIEHVTNYFACFEDKLQQLPYRHGHIYCMIIVITINIALN